MREAARVLDDVSDHLGEVLRRSDELLAEWSRFGAQVRTQVDREAAAIGEVIDGAVARVASTGIDRAIADRLRALTAEIERLEQRTRAAARAASEQRDGDRRVLWIVVAGIVLANALLVALLLRKPDAAPVVEPIRLESTAAPQSPPGSPQGLVPGGSADPTSTQSAASVTNAGSAAGSSDAAAPGAGAGSGVANVGGSAGPAAAGAKPGGAAPTALVKPAAPPDNAAKPPEAAGAAKGSASPVALPPKGGTPRPHKKLP
jgi:hypothetical protein